MNYSIITKIEGDRIENIKYKEIDYKGTKVKVSKNGDVIWNGIKRNVYYNKDGYAVCSIKTEGGWRSTQVARLVALAYIPNPNNLPEVNHKDYNRENPNVDNLEWISRADNVRYSNCNRPDYKGNKNPNYGNHKLSKIYAENKEYALEKQSRKGLQNGRCKKIKMILPDGTIKEFGYIGLCCEYLKKNIFTSLSLNTIRLKIYNSTKSNTEFKGIRFIKE